MLKGTQVSTHENSSYWATGSFEIFAETQFASRQNSLTKRSRNPLNQRERIRLGLLLDQSDEKPIHTNELRLHKLE